MANPLIDSGTVTVSNGLPVVQAGANVAFKVGTQQTINNIISSQLPNSQETRINAEHGTFYLTEDSHRLYIGNSDGSLSAVNEGIKIVSNVDQLPSLNQQGIGADPYIGQFYYIKGASSNILCVATYDANTGQAKWVQLNPDTYLDTSNSSLTVGASSTIISNDESNWVTPTNGALVTSTIRDTGGRVISQGWAIKSLGNIEVKYNSNSHIIGLKVPDSGIYKQFFETVTSGGNEVGVKIILKEFPTIADRADNTNGTVVGEYILQDGDGGVKPRLQADGKTILLDGGGLKGGSISLIQNNSSQPITLRLADSKNNRIETDITPTITLGTHTPIAFDLTQTATAGTNNADRNAYTLNATLPVYTKAEIDNMVNLNARTSDAMYFAGTIGAGGTISSVEAIYDAADGNTGDSAQDANYTRLAIKNGATFKFIAAATKDSTHASQIIEGNDGHFEAGDMIIITGEEGTSGLIADLSAATTKYMYIPSGNDDDIYYTPTLGESADTEMKFVQHTTGPSPQTYGFGISSGTQISVSAANSTPSGYTGKKTFTINHSTINVNGGSATASSNTYGTSGTPTADTAITFAANEIGNVAYTAITDISYDNGHITGWKTKQITLTHNKLTKVTSTVAADNSLDSTLKEISAVQLSKAYTQSTGALNAGDYNNNVRFGSSTLKITVPTGGTGTATGLANTPAKVNIDMVWGQF